MRTVLILVTALLPTVTFAQGAAEIPPAQTPEAAAKADPAAPRKTFGFDPAKIRALLDKREPSRPGKDIAASDHSFMADLRTQIVRCWATPKDNPPPEVVVEVSYINQRHTGRTAEIDFPQVRCAVSASGQLGHPCIDKVPTGKAAGRKIPGLEAF